MNTSLFCTLQTRISEAMLEAEGGWGKYPKTVGEVSQNNVCMRETKQCTRARKREILMREREILMREREILMREYGRQQMDWCSKPISIGEALLQLQFEMWLWHNTLCRNLEVLFQV